MLRPLSAARRGLLLLTLACLLATVTALSVRAQGTDSRAALRVASAFDPQTMDPHAIALLYHSRVVFQLYESLVTRDERFKAEPGLAVSWQMMSPTVWRFRLRPGVTFHDGSPFTADDAVFSLERALAQPSQRAFQLKGVTAVRKLDPLNIEMQLEAPDAVLPEKLQGIGMMSKAWSEKHGVTRAQDFNGKQETHAVRNANGTGPMRLDRYEPDVRTVLRRHAAWWGWADKRHGNVEQVVFVTVKSDATRLAALASEAAHLDFAASDADAAGLARTARVEGRLTAEAVLSGPGLLRLHTARCALEGGSSAVADGVALVDAALTDPAGPEARTVALFLRLLAGFAGDMTLAFAATGGVWLGGGILPRLRPLIDPVAFRAAFEAKAPVEWLPRRVPVRLIMSPDAVLAGMAAIAADPSRILIDWPGRLWR